MALRRDRPVGVEQPGQQCPPILLRGSQVGSGYVLVEEHAEAAQCRSQPTNVVLITVALRRNVKPIGPDQVQNLWICRGEATAAAASVAKPCSQGVRRHRQRLMITGLKGFGCPNSIPWATCRAWRQTTRDVLGRQHHRRRAL